MKELIMRIGAVLAAAVAFLTTGSALAAEHTFTTFLTGTYQNTDWECADVDTLAQWTFSGKMGGAWVNSKNMKESTGFFVTKQGDGVTFEMQTLDGQTKAVLVMLKIENGSVWAKGIKAAYRENAPLGTQMFSDATGTLTSGTAGGTLATNNDAGGYGVAQIIAVSPASAVREAELKGEYAWASAPWGADGAPSDADTGAKLNVTGASKLTIDASVICSSIEVTGTADLTIDAGDLLTCDAITVTDYTGTLTLKAAKAFAVDFGAANFIYEYIGEEPASATISGTGAFTKSGAGALEVAGAAFGAEYTGTITISAGTLSVGTIKGFGAVPTISIAAGATWEVTSSSIGGFEDADCSNVAGEGTVKFRSIGATTTEYRWLPPADKMWATTLGFENAAAGGVRFVSDADYTFGTLSGTGDFWATSGTEYKMIVNQSANSTWSGRLRSGSVGSDNAIVQNNNFRRTFVLAGQDNATLTVSGAIGQNNDIVIEPTGSLVLTGSWTAPQVTVDGAIGGTGSIAGATNIAFGASATINASAGVLSLNLVPTFGETLTVSIDEIEGASARVLNYSGMVGVLPEITLHIGGETSMAYTFIEDGKGLSVVNPDQDFAATLNGGEVAWAEAGWDKTWVNGGRATLTVNSATTLKMNGTEQPSEFIVTGEGELTLIGDNYAFTLADVQKIDKRSTAAVRIVWDSGDFEPETFVAPESGFIYRFAGQTALPFIPFYGQAVAGTIELACPVTTFANSESMFIGNKGLTVFDDGFALTTAENISLGCNSANVLQSFVQNGGTLELTSAAVPGACGESPIVLSRWPATTTYALKAGSVLIENGVVQNWDGAFAVQIGDPNSEKTALFKTKGFAINRGNGASFFEIFKNGTLAIGGNGVTANDSKAFKLNGGTLEAYGTFSSGFGAGIQLVSASTIKVTEGNTLTVTSALAGEGAIAKAGAGTLKLGTNRPTLGAIEGTVVFTVTDAEAASGVVIIPTTQTEYADNAILLVNGAGEEFGYEKRTVVDNEVKFTFPTAVVRTSGNVSAWGEYTGDINIMAENAEATLSITNDVALPEAITSVKLLGKVNLVFNDTAFISEKFQIAPGAEVKILVSTECSFALPTGLQSAQVVVQKGGVFKFNNGTVTSVLVEEGGILDANGKGDLQPQITLAGGTFKNSGGVLGDNLQQFASITLTTNSTIDVSGNTFGSIAGSYNNHTIDLNGYTLTKTGGGEFLTVNTTFTSGTIAVEEGIFSIDGGAIAQGTTLTLAPTTEGTVEFVRSKRNVDNNFAKNGTLNLEGAGLVVYENRTWPAVNGMTSWTGTVWVKNPPAMAGTNFNSFGVTGSTVKLTGVTGWMVSGGATFNPTVELADNGETPALKITDNSNRTYKFTKLTGDGSLVADSGSQNGCSIVVANVEDFIGTLKSVNKPIYIGNSSGHSNESKITIDDGMVIDSRCKLVAQNIVFGRTVTIKGVKGDVIATGLTVAPANLERVKVTMIDESGKTTRGRLSYEDGTLTLVNAEPFILMLK